MPKITVNISDDAIVILHALAEENERSQNSIVTQALIQMAMNKEGDTLRDITPLQDELARLRVIASNNEKHLAVLHSAFNNFLLNFAPTPDDFVSLQTEVHEWLKKAWEQYNADLKQKAHRKKWSDPK